MAAQNLPTPITSPSNWADLTVRPYGLENRIVSGPQVLLEALARRLNTPRGGLLYDAGYGFDIRQFINSRLNDETSYLLTTGVEAELTADPRVLSATVEIILGDTVNPNRKDAVRTARDQIDLSVNLETTIGPWRGIIRATASNVILFEAGSGA